MSDLLPCPFCGGEPELIECDVPPYEGGDVIQCKRCQASSNVTFSCGEDGRPKVISAWNRRVTDPRVADMTRALEQIANSFDWRSQEHLAEIARASLASSDSNPSKAE